MNVLKLFTIGCALSVLTLGAEVVDMSQKSAWNTGRVSAFKDGKITSAGRMMLIGKKQFVVDPAKSYTISMDVKRLKADKINPTILIGYEGIDAKGRPLPVTSYQCLPQSLTEVTAAAKKGDTTLRIKDASKWRTGNGYFVVVNAKADFSDIPNRQTVASWIKSIRKSGEEYIITLGKPLNRDVAAGTKIRAHIANGYFYVSPTVQVNTDKTYSLKYVTKGVSDYGLINKKSFPRGAAKWRVIVLVNWSASQGGMEISNARFTIE